MEHASSHDSIRWGEGVVLALMTTVYFYRLYIAYHVSM